MKTFVHNDGGRKDAGFKAERVGDCVARAISIAAGLPYIQVYNRLAYGNENQRITKKTRKAKAGKRTAEMGISTNRVWFKRYMKSLGFVWVPTMKIGSGCKVHLKAEELPQGRLVVAVSKHYTAIIDGVINDTYDCSRGGTRCVYGYYRLLDKRELLMDKEKVLTVKT